jgi:organic radical activating enzyme
VLLSRSKNGLPEIFATVQGEGVSVGTPSVFIRLAECNLKCTWCDTRYTWDWTTYDREAETVELEPHDVVARTLAMVQDSRGVRNAVLTGGEPLLQQDALALVARQLGQADFRIEVETNGTIVPTADLDAVVHQWNVSPKLASSGNAERARHRPNALAWFAAKPNAQLKFVVTREEDIAEVTELTNALGLPKERVVLTPEGIDAAAIAAGSRWVADRCRQYGYRLGTRLHVFVWGNERGR